MYCNKKKKRSLSNSDYKRKSAGIWKRKEKKIKKI